MVVVVVVVGSCRSVIRTVEMRVGDGMGAGRGGGGGGG